MRHLLLAAAILGGGSAAIAQSTTPPPYQDSIVVTASLEAEEPEELPTSVAVIDAEEIAARQATEVVELLRTVPGAAVVRQGSPGKLSSFFLRGASSAQTLVLWNGVQLNDPSFGGFDWAFLSTDGVDRIEVVRGPFSPLYGSEAIGGVVQVLTGSRRTGTQLRLEGGGDGYLRGGLSAGFQTGSLHTDVAAFLRRGDGELDNDFYDGEGGLGRLAWAVDGGLDVALVGRFNDSEVGLPFDFFGNPSPRQISTRNSHELALPVTWTGSRWELEGQLFTLGSDLTTVNPDFGSRDATEVERQGARLVATRHLSDRLWVAGGGDWEREQATTVSSFGAGLDGDTQRTRSVFAQLHGAAGPVRFDLGARRDDNDVFGAETSLKVGAVWAPTSGVRLHASYGEGFRAPSLGELFFPGFGNPELEAEQSTGVELGLELERGPWRWSLTVFDNDFENLIVSAPPTFLPFNIGRAEARGVETLVAVATERVSARLATTYLDSEDLATGDPLLRRPDWSSNLVLTWHPDRRWSLNAVGRYVGRRTDLGGVTLDAYTTVDLAAAWRIGERVEPYARIENLFEEAYEEAVGFPAPDRALIGGVALHF